MEYEDGQPVTSPVPRTLAPGGAARCRLHRYHYPPPLRLVVHHILPREHGGTSHRDNLAIVCDNGHYATHELLDELLEHGVLATRRGTRSERALAWDGYNRRTEADDR